MVERRHLPMKLYTKGSAPANLISIPFGPEALNEAIQALGSTGKTMFPMERLFWTCAAGATTAYPLTLPTGFVCTRRFCILSSDFYDPGIIVNVSVDGQDVTPFGIALTGLTTIDFGQYYAKHREILISTANATVTAAVLTLEIVPSLLEKSFYDSFYVPIIEYMDSALQEIAYGP